MRIREWPPKQLEILILGLLSQTSMLINDVEGPHRLLPWSLPEDLESGIEEVLVM